MMNLQQRISALAELGKQLPQLVTGALLHEVSAENPWFTRSEVIRALNAWSELLMEENLIRWTSRYEIPTVAPGQNILVITAGNLPLVGFHDFLSVVITGNRFIGKLSSKDNLLLTCLTNELVKIEPRFAGQISYQPDQNEPVAVIATGSNNSARYFRNEYGKIPHIIRKNRSSAAIIRGSETTGELNLLAADVLTYYGLGCRSVSHLYLPSGYSIENLIDPLSHFGPIDPCESYADNLRYQWAGLKMVKTPFIDAGQAILTESGLLHSTVGVVHFSFYGDLAVLLESLNSRKEEIQCIVGHQSISTKLIPFGSAQKPELWDYADEVDTIEFLGSLPTER